MNRELAGKHLWNVRRAWAGANLCRERLAAQQAAAPTVAGISNLTGLPTHDVDYYAWEAVRIIKIAEKVVGAGMRGKGDVQAALDHLESVAPELKNFRDAVTHVEDNRTADDVIYFGEAVRLRGGRVQYLVDPRYQHHDGLRALFLATEKALLTLAAPDDSPFPRYDNSAT